MGNNAVFWPWIRGRSECVINVVSEMVKKFQFCREVLGCNVVGGYYGLYVSCYVLGIVSSSVCGVGGACVSYHCS